MATHQNTYPEVYYPAATPEVVQYPHGENNFGSVPLNSFNDTATVTDASKGQYHGTNPYQPYDHQSAQGILPSIGQPSERQKRTICGHAINLVFFLSVATALLSIAVIGLAAGTGLQSKRANDADAKLAALLANISNIDRGCSADPDGVTGSEYTSQCTFPLGKKNDGMMPVG